MAGMGAFLVLFVAKMASKLLGVYPATLALGHRGREAAYTTLMMSTGLTFGTISSLYGLTHGIIDRDQYSLLVATVIASAVVPTWLANRFFLPHHHLEEARAPRGRWFPVTEKAIWLARAERRSGGCSVESL